MALLFFLKKQMFLQKTLDAVRIKKRELPNIMSGSPPLATK